MQRHTAPPGAAPAPPARHLPAALVALAAAAGSVAAGSGPWVAVGGVALLAAVVALAAHLSRRIGRLQGELWASDHRARLDPLTGLLNRTGLLEEVARRLAARRPGELVAVLFLDVDRLKVINDSIGHAAGDEVLQAVAHRLASVLRDDDAFGRLGGDEFVVVTSGLRSVGDLGRLAQRILDEVAAPVTLVDQSRQVATASIGIAYVLKGEPTAEDLLRDADVAMYRAKDAGGSGWAVFDGELRARVLARVELERELRLAVRDGELVVQYQPLVTAATGVVDAVEALVRWRHPTRGLIPPDQFLSVASESGLIIELGEHVLTTACAQAARWSAQHGRPVAVAVNLAERQLLDHALADTVAAVLAATGLPPAQLQLEVAEGLLVHRPERHLAVLRRLSALGVRVALDDFGAAHASLCQLRALDVLATLKLDRAFVAGVTASPVDRTVAAAVLALAGSLGMEVVAEGVEDAEQAAVLVQLGVHRLQGFHLQRPAEAAAIAPLLARPLELPGLALR